MRAISKYIMDAQASVQDAIAAMNRGEYLSDTDVTFLTDLVQAVKNLRNSAIRKAVHAGLPQQTVAEIYSLSASRVSQIMSSEPIEVISGMVNVEEDSRLLELGSLAFTDVRGQRIVETMRKKIADGARPGITVMGPHVTVRFNGVEKNMQSVTMQVISVIDSAVHDTSFDEED